MFFTAEAEKHQKTALHGFWHDLNLGVIGKL
jgi:hypothetical protein